MINIDAQVWAKQNVWRLPSLELCVRPGLRRIYTPDSGKTIVGGFSIPNEFTGEMWHYVFDVESSGGRSLRLVIMDEDFQVFQIFAINADVVPRVITHCVVQGQIIIASPDFPPLWGLVGSSVRIAIKVASVNESTTAIDVPRGICTSWCNRCVIASGNSLFVSDPIAATGGDLRTYVAENQNQRPGVVYGIHEGAGGMLTVLTSAGTYGLDSASVAVQIVGSVGTDWRLLNHARVTSFASSAVVRGLVYALSMDGWHLVDQESNEEQVLTEPVMPRAYGPRVSVDDYRTCRMYSGDLGPVVAADVVNAVSMVDSARSIISWWKSSHSPTSFILRGLLREPDGNQLLLCSNGAFRYVGNFDGEIALTSGVATQPKGVVSGTLSTTPSQSQTVRHVHVAGEVGGANSLYAAVRGASRNFVPYVDPDGITIGTDSWGSTKRYTTTPLIDCRFDFGPEDNASGRDIGIEVAVDSCLARIQPVVDIEMSESAPLRPSDTSENVLSTIATISNQTAPSASPFSFTPTTTNVTGFTLSYSMVGTLPAGLSINASTGAITGTPTTPGVTTGLAIKQSYTGVATGSVNSSQFSFTVT